MLAFAAVWLALASLLIAIAMVVYRPVFTDLSVVLVLYFGSPGALCFALLTLWAFRKEDGADTGLQARRLQCKVAVVMALAAAVIVYMLIIFSAKLDTIEQEKTAIYNPAGIALERPVLCQQSMDGWHGLASPGREAYEENLAKLPLDHATHCLSLDEDQKTEFPTPCVSS